MSDYLTVDDRIHLPLLIELVQIDREVRVKRGEAAPMDDYRQNFPELAAWLESDKPAAAAEPASIASDPSVAERPGEKIGPYKLLDQLGVGGFGMVFVAEQEWPVRRKSRSRSSSPAWTPARSSPASRPSVRCWP